MAGTCLGGVHTRSEGRSSSVGMDAAWDASGTEIDLCVMHSLS